MLVQKRILPDALADMSDKYCEIARLNSQSLIDLIVVRRDTYKAAKE